MQSGFTVSRLYARLFIPERATSHRGAPESIADPRQNHK
jgi:hypothetical protein